MNSDKVQLFLWFLASSGHDVAVQAALKTVSLRLAAEFEQSPTLYRRCSASPATLASPSEAQEGGVIDGTNAVSTWMEVHPPVATSEAEAYLGRVERVAMEAGLLPYLQGPRHAEWFTCV